MRSIIILLLLAVVSFPLGCGGVPNVYPPTIRPSAFDPEQLKPIDYKVISGDKREIFVWQHTDLTRDIIVRPDGKISFPLIGDIEAQGRTLTEIDDEVTRKLAEYLVSPQVSVTVKEFAGEKVIVLGEVSKPGVYKFFGRASFLDIIAEAGGLTRDAQWGNALVIRGELKADAEKSDVILLDINEIINGNLRNNIVIYPRDIIYVSTKPIADVGRYLRDYVSPVLSNLVRAKGLSDAMQKK